MKEMYPWLVQDDERINMSDREILDKYCRFRKILSIRFRKETGHGNVK